MGLQQSTRSCPVCGAGLNESAAICASCNLVVPTYREVATTTAGIPLHTHEKLKILTVRFMLCAVLIVGMAILRYLVDRPPVSLTDSLVCTLFLLAATRWGGVLAAIITIVVIFGADYFVIDPTLQLGINTWRGMFEIVASAAIGTGVGIIAARLFQNRRDRLRLFIA